MKEKAGPELFPLFGLPEGCKDSTSRPTALARYLLSGRFFLPRLATFSRNQALDPRADEKFLDPSDLGLTAAAVISLQHDAQKASLIFG